MKTKDDIINLSKATINSLEMDKISKTNAVIECRNIFEDQKRKIAELEKKCSNNKQDDNQTKTLKKAETDIKKLKKDMDEKDKRIKEVLVKLNRETEKRSKAEADVVRVSKLNHSMTKLLEKKEEREKREDKEKREKERREREKERTEREKGRRSPREKVGDRSGRERHEEGRQSIWQQREIERKRWEDDQYKRREEDNRRRRESEERRQRIWEEDQRRDREECNRGRRRSGGSPRDERRRSPDFLNTLATTLLSVVDAQRDQPRLQPAPASAGRRH